MRKYNFECFDCGCEFTVEEKYLVQKENLICPNCSAKLPDNIFNELKTAATALMEYDKNHPDITMDESIKHFKLGIQ